MYDYQKGSLWAVVQASSAAWISAQYPSLWILDSPPQCLDRATIDMVWRAGEERRRLDWMHELLQSNAGAAPPNPIPLS